MSSNRIQMKQPFKILIDIWGVITSWNYLEDLNNYINDNIFDFFERNYERYPIQDFIKRLKEQTNEDKTTNPELPLIVELSEENKKKVIESVIDNMKWRKNNGLKTFSRDTNEIHQSIWSEGYESGRLLVHVFDDVIPAFKYWTSEDLGIKIYTFASGSAQKQKAFLRSTVVGDLNQYIVNGINSFHSYKRESKKFHQIFSALLERHPQNILYLTDSPNKARPAIQAEFRSIVVLRPGNRTYTDEKLNGIQVIKSLYELEFLIA